MKTAIDIELLKDLHIVADESCKSILKNIEHDLQYGGGNIEEYACELVRHATAMGRVEQILYNSKESIQNN